jgi:hypothetical protein
MNQYIELVKSAVTFTSHNHKSESQNTLSEVSQDDLMDVLSSDRRRWILEILASKDPDATVHLSDLAESVAAREYGCDPDELSSDQRKRVYISLSQQHLDFMSPAVLEYDRDRKIITPTDKPAVIWHAYSTFREELDH